jgi:hypothetical protein
MKQAKIQWLQDPNQSNVDNLNNAQRETSIHIRNRQKEEDLKSKTDEIDTNNKIKKISRTCIGASVILTRVAS